MKVVVNYVDELIDALITETAKAKRELKAGSRITAQYLMNQSSRISEEIMSKNKSIRVLNKDAMRQLFIILVRYSIIFYLIHEALCKKGDRSKDLISFLLSLQSIQEQMFITPLVLSNITAAYAYALKAIHSPTKTLTDVSEDVRSLLTKDIRARSFDNLVRYVILTHIYITNDKWSLQEIVENVQVDDDYTYIDVVELQEEILSRTYLEELGVMEADDFMDLVGSMSATMTTQDDLSRKLDFLFQNDYLIPVTHDFSRFHRPIRNNVPGETRLSSLLRRIRAARNYNLAEKNNLWMPQKRELFMIEFNAFDEFTIISKLLESPYKNTSNRTDIYELLSYRNEHYFNFHDAPFHYSPEIQVVAVRSANIIHPPKNTAYDIRNVCSGSDINLYGVIIGSRGVLHHLITSSPPKLDRISVKESVHTARKHWLHKQSGGSFLRLDTKSLTVIDDLYNLAQEIRQARINRVVRSASSLIERRKRVSFYDNMDDTIMTMLIMNSPVPEGSKDVLQRRDRPHDPGHVGTNRTVPLARCAHNVIPQDPFVFVKKFATLTKDESIVCKSCGEGLEAVMFRIGQGIIDPSTGEYILTSIANNVRTVDRKENMRIQNLLHFMDRNIRVRVSRIFSLNYLEREEADIDRDRLISETINLISAHRNQKASTDPFNIFTPLSLDESMIADTGSRETNLLFLYIVLILLLRLSRTEIAIFVKKSLSICPSSFYLKNKDFFEELSLGSVPVLCLMLTQAACLIYHYGLYNDKQQKRPQAVRTIITTLTYLLKLILKNDSMPDRLLQAQMTKNNTFQDGTFVNFLLQKTMPPAPHREPRPPPTPLRGCHIKNMGKKFILRAAQLTTLPKPVKWEPKELQRHVQLSIKPREPLEGSSTTKSSLRKRNLNEKAFQQALKDVEKRLGKEFYQEKIMIDHDHKGIPLDKPLVFSSSVLKKSVLNDRECWVLEQKTHSVLYDGKTLMLVGYRLSSTRQIMHYTSSPPWYLTFVSSARSRILYIAEGGVIVTLHDRINALRRKNNELGRVDAMEEKENVDNEVIKSSIKARVIQARASYHRLVIEFFRAFGKRPSKIVDYDPSVTGKECALHILNLILGIEKVPATKIVDILLANLPELPTHTAYTRLSQYMVYSDNFHKSETLNEIQEEPQSITLDEMIADIDMEDPVFESED